MLKTPFFKMIKQIRFLNIRRLPMFLHRRFIPGLAIASYIVADEKSKRAVVIDPVRDVTEYLSIVKEKGFVITDILETHVHADFVSGSLELKSALHNEATIHCSGMGGKKWIPAYADKIVHDEDQILFGDLLLEAFYTPGHTPEHLSWKLYDLSAGKSTPWAIFTGDFLFVGEVGRPDLLGQENQKILAHELYNSLFEKLESYPDFIEIFPAHGAGSLCGKNLSSRPNSTLGYERQFNPALKKLPEEEWTQNLMHNMPKAPPYFSHMKQINVRGPSILGASIDSIEPFNAKKVYELQLKGVQVLDLRDKEAFGASHIPGAINIPFSQMFATYAGSLLNWEDQFILLGGSSLAKIALARIGFDHVIGYLEGEMNGWLQEKLPTQELPTVSTLELFNELQKELKPIVIDVRTDDEWLNSHIESAIHYPLKRIGEDLLSELDQETPIYVICGSGMRSSMMASCLQQKGFLKVKNVMGGMNAWTRITTL